ISPRNLHNLVVKMLLLFPEAPNITRSGKAIRQHKVSYNPFIHIFSVPPMRGIANSETKIRPHIQNVFVVAIGLNILESNSPAENENKNRKDPAVNSIPVNENPAQISPYGPKIANVANPSPAAMTKPISTLLENRRII